MARKLAVTVLVVLAVIAGITLLGGPAPEPETTEPETTDAEAPPYTIVERREGDFVVEVDDAYTPDELREIFETIVEENRNADERGYWVLINCSTGGTSASEPRLANGKFAIGDLGAAQTGLEPGGSEFSTNDDLTCPRFEGVEADIALARSVVDAFQAKGLPAANPRDNTAGSCPLMDNCTALITTDEISVYVFPDTETATSYSTRPSSSAHSNGRVVLSYLAAGTPESARPRYEAALAEGIAGGS